jgi:hypothetical protein
MYFRHSSLDGCFLCHYGLYGDDMEGQQVVWQDIFVQITEFGSLVLTCPMP